MRAALVLPAAGSGSRFGSDGPPKQLRPLAGRPLLCHALTRFCGLITEAVMPVAPAFRDEVAAAVADLPIDFPLRLVAGGRSRQESVGLGIAAVDPACTAVLIHDAARPLVPPAIITACLVALGERQAAVVAVPCHATVKRIEPISRTVAATVPRDDLWLAQTPQGLHRALAVELFARAAAEERCYSDDVQLCEAAGIPVAIVPGEPTNLKVTTPADLALAEALLRSGMAGPPGA